MNDAQLSSKEFQKASRIYRRTRSAVACERCKSAEVKCNDFRPCNRCAYASTSCQNKQGTKNDMRQKRHMSVDKNPYLSSQTDKSAVCRTTADPMFNAGLHKHDTIALVEGLPASTTLLTSTSTIPNFPNIRSSSSSLLSTQVALSHQFASLPLFEPSPPVLPPASSLITSILHDYEPQSFLPDMQQDSHMMFALSPQTIAPLLPRFWVQF